MCVLDLLIKHSWALGQGSRIWKALLVSLSLSYSHISCATSVYVTSLGFLMVAGDVEPLQDQDYTLRASTSPDVGHLCRVQGFPLRWLPGRYWLENNQWVFTLLARRFLRTTWGSCQCEFLGSLRRGLVDYEDNCDAVEVYQAWAAHSPSTVWHSH